MTSFDELKALLFRKRNWKYFAGFFLLLAVLGQASEHISALEALKQFTYTLRDDLRAVQPFAVAEMFWHAMGDRTKDGLPGIALGTIVAIPGLAVSIWRVGGFIPGLLYSLTLLGMAVAIITQWRGVRTGENGVLASAVATLWILAAGPIVAGAAFWVLLWFLIILLIIFGKVLAGLIWLLTTFLTVFKVGGEILKMLKEADELERKTSPVPAAPAAASVVPPITPASTLPPPTPPAAS